MIKAAIVGCGKIADAHAWAISQIPDAEIVGVCDNEELMANQLCSES
jgi:predicted dehydrogenase